MKFVPSAISTRVVRQVLVAQKNSPGLLFGAGVIGMAASTVLACRATLKMDDLLEEAKDRLDDARSLQHFKYTEKDRTKDVSLIHFQTTIKIAKLYAPSVIVGGLSIAALTKSHSILNQRNAALTAAYAALDKGFREYRTRVVEKYGEEEDRNFRYNTEEVEIKDEKGDPKTVTRIGPGQPSIYARFFDQTSPSWNPEPVYNMAFINAQQNWANDRLRGCGHVFLNEVYDMFGFDRTKEGAVVGWVMNKDGSGDNYVDFGVFDGRTQVARDFVNGREGAILLDFNVDGIIYDKIEDVDKELKSWRKRN